MGPFAPVPFPSVELTGRFILAGRNFPGCVGDFTKSLATSLGCKLVENGEKDFLSAGAEVVPSPLNRVLPRIMVSLPSWLETKHLGANC